VIQFDLNISITMPTLARHERIERAAALGFGSIEFWWPANEDLGALATRIRDAHLQVALFNFDAGALAAGERGLLNDAARDAQFRQNVPVALEFAHAIGCTRINALVGNALPDVGRDEQLARVRDNLHWACEQARDAGVTVLVESLNPWDTPRYLLLNTPDTLALLDTVDAPNLQYQYDTYHMQRAEGNLAANIKAHIGRIGHIQIADSPGRGQPGTGELRFPYLFQTIVEAGYKGLVGLEFVPQGSIEDSLAWLPHELRRSLVALDQIQF
jgi:hydroxypyruvate isomerase